MNPGLLVKQFDRISDAPDAIPRLRRFVLDLAVRGKLMEQDPADEPASALIKRVRLRKAEIAKKGALRKEKPFPPLAENALPFRIPPTWSWSQIAEIGFLNPRNTAEDQIRSSFVPMPRISAEYGVSNTHEVRPWGEIKSGFTHFAEGDVGLAKITPCFENGKSAVFRGLTGGIGAGTTELHIVRPVIVLADYVLIFLKSPHFIESGTAKMTGTAGQKRVSTEYFAYSPFPLPPLAEQHRIVAKVDELMGLCDRLETAQRERESRRERLASSSHHHLNNGADAETFRGYANFYLRNFPRITHYPGQIKQLRETILNLAIRGQLTNKSDEFPTGASPQDATFSGLDIRLPAHWSIQPLTKVASSIVDCPHSTPKWTSEGKICVRTNQFRPGHLDLKGVRFVSESTYRERIQRLQPAENDILYSREGGILGVACRVPPNTQLCLGQRMMLIRAGAMLDAAFLEMVMNSPLITGIALAKTTGGAAPRINVATVKAYPIPLPPIAEQYRIVTKVDELMGLCDRLELVLTTTQRQTRSLLEAILHQALNTSHPTIERRSPFHPDIIAKDADTRKKLFLQ